MQQLGDFLIRQVLGMAWLNDLIGLGLSGMGVDVAQPIGTSVRFFIYDVIKILTLLSVMIFVISWIQSYFTPQRSRALIGRFKGVFANLIAALLGTVTPFCSCGSIPLFIGFTNAGLPVGVTFSFLISSPLVDIGALVLLTSVFGPQLAFSYVLVGLVLAVAGGSLINALGMEKHVIRFAAPKVAIDLSAAPKLRAHDRFVYSLDRVAATVKKVWPYVLAGVGVGAVIHNWLPIEWIQTVLGEQSSFAVLLATLVGVPMYADIFGVIPIAEALLAKGAGTGTVLAFMMAVTALSLPSIIMLKKVVRLPLLVLFIGIVTTGIVIIGYAFNALGIF